MTGSGQSISGRQGKFVSGICIQTNHCSLHVERGPMESLPGAWEAHLEKRAMKGLSVVLYHWQPGYLAGQ